MLIRSVTDSNSSACRLLRAIEKSRGSLRGFQFLAVRAEVAAYDRDVSYVDLGIVVQVRVGPVAHVSNILSQFSCGIREVYYFHSAIATDVSFQPDIKEPALDDAVGQVWIS